MKRSIRQRVALSLILLGAAFLAYRATLPEQVVSPGTGIQFDDFVFTAENVVPMGDHYAVSVKVSNQAKRVPFTFRPSCVHVEDGTGSWRRLETQLLNDTLAPGESRSFLIPFEAPGAPNKCRISFRFGGPLGETADAILLGRKAVQVKIASAKSSTADRTA
jgi:hypothetical protein